MIPPSPPPPSPLMQTKIFLIFVKLHFSFYFQMNAESSNHGRLIHMLSPCSDMNTNTSRLSPSPLHKQSTTGGLAQVKRKVDTIGNTQECLI